MDPAKGALAIDARLQTVAASDSSEGSPSQPAESSGPPASRSAAPQMPETACTASAVNAPGQRHGEARDLQDTSAATAIDLERRRRAVPSVNGFQPQHLDRQQAGPSRLTVHDGVSYVAGCCMKVPACHGKESMRLGNCRHQGARLHSNKRATRKGTPLKSVLPSSSLGMAGGGGRASSMEAAGESFLRENAITESRHCACNQ